MINRFQILSCCIAAVFIFFTACDDPSVPSTYNFKVMSSDGPFTGYYSVDGGSFQYFDGSLASGSSYFYSYEKNLSSPDSIMVYAIGTDTSATSISIFIYEDGALGDSITVSQSTDSYGNDLKVVATISYTFNESDD